MALLLGVTASKVFSIIGYIIVALLTLMVMIVIHEFGHYIVGKALKFKINEFAIGFGPPIFRFMMRSGEYFSIRPIPLGGFCAFEGEDAESVVEGSFNSQAPWKRILVLLAGVTFNIISAFLILAICFSTYGYSLPKVAGFYESTDSSFVHTLQKDDIIYELDGQKVYSFTSYNISTIIEKAESDTMKCIVIRDGEKVKINVTVSKFLSTPVYDESSYDENKNLIEGAEPIRYEESENKMLGISVATELYRVNFFEGLVKGIVYCGQIIVFLFQTIGSLFTGEMALQGNLGGPITTVSVIANTVSYTGFRGVLTLLGMMSANVAIFNILPLPALDGCKVVFTLIEWIVGKPINRKVEGIISTVGLFLLFAMTIVFDLFNLGFIGSLF